MREHELLILLREQDKVNVYYNAALDKLYEDLFRRARRSVYRDSSNVENGIKAIIFGCFLVEARCNNVFRQLLFKEIQNPMLAAKIWTIIKRTNILKKLDALTPFASVRLRERFSELSNGLNLVFELRNRLAHFKDENVLLGELEEAEDLLDYFHTLPRPTVLAELESPRIREHLTVLVQTKRWLDYIYRRHFREVSENAV